MLSDPGVMVAIISGTFLVLAGLLTWSSTRGKTQADSKTASDKRIDDRVDAQLQRAWDRIDALELEATERDAQLRVVQETVENLVTTDRRKMSAVARIFRAIQRQWPSADGPDLDPYDIREIEETIPVEWIRKPRDTPAASG